MKLSKRQITFLSILVFIFVLFPPVMTLRKKLYKNILNSEAPKLINIKPTAKPLSITPATTKVTPTCRPRPACLDSKPRCMLPETDDMCPKNAPTKVPEPPANGCIVSGCSGEICSEEERFSTCIYNPKNECYKSALCEKQPNGKCGWTETNSLTVCLSQY